MTKADIKAGFIELDKWHRRARESGYALRDAMTAYVKDLPAESVNDAIDVLLECASEYPGELWDVSLLCLVDLGRPGTDDRIAELLERDAGKTDEWRDALVFSLVRLRTSTHRASCVDYIRRESADRSESMGFLIPPVILIDRNAFIDLAATYWTKLLTGVVPCMDPVAAVPPFIANIASVDTNMLTVLADEIGRRSEMLRTRFVTAVRAYLDQPWVKREWNQDIVARLREK